MTRTTDKTFSRRGFLKAVTTVSALALLAKTTPKPDPRQLGNEIVEIDGWILMRSDLA